MTEAVPNSYASSGVDVQAGARAVDLMKTSIAAAQRPEVVGAFGGFAGLFDASALLSYKRPLLATATDGVGTKVAVAQAMDVHDTIGRDLVAMVLDDLVVCGAEPLFMTDYIACGKVVPEKIAAIVSGIAAGCTEAGCALVGGETAEHPGLLGLNDYDVAGAGTGLVEAAELLGSHRVQVGDVLIGLAASGLHSNGYSLARGVLINNQRANLDRHVDELGRTIGEELLEPTRIYAQPCLQLARADIGVHAMSHITGGGLAANLSRVLPSGLTAHVDRSTWTPLPVFDLIAGQGSVRQHDMEQAFNMGVGMVLVVAADQVTSVMRRAQALDERLLPWVLGDVRVSGHNDIASAPPKGGHGGITVVTGTYA